MASKLTAFKNAVLVHNVVARVLEATEFKSPEALEAYLHAHGPAPPPRSKRKMSLRRKRAPRIVGALSRMLFERGSLLSRDGSSSKSTTQTILSLRKKPRKKRTRRRRLSRMH